MTHEELRQLFEREFPVPGSIVPFRKGYVTASEKPGVFEAQFAIEYHAKWIGFQAGYKAAIGHKVD